MKFDRYVFILILTFVFLSPMVHAQSTFARIQKQQEMLKVGEVAYANRCAGCHGLEGKGQGAAAKMLDPRPRDFTKGVFKIKHAAIGDMPSDQDLYDVIDKGIPGTSMPSFSLVTENEKRALVAYLKTFAPKQWKKQSPDKYLPELKLPKDVFTKKSAFLANAKRGRAWFQELGCVSCHGATGLGDGSSAKTLKDAWGDPILPANLREAYVKRGFRAQDVAYSIMYGVDGTPMPAHNDILQYLEEKFPELKEKSYIWELTAFVFYLRGKEAGFFINELPEIPAAGIPRDEVMSVIGKYFE